MHSHPIAPLVPSFSVRLLACAALAGGPLIVPLANAGEYTGAGGVIPDGIYGENTPGYLVSAITATDSGAVSKLTVTLQNLTHSWIGDVSATLTHVESGATQSLFHRVGFPTTPPFGDSSNLGGNYAFADSFVGDLWAAAAQGGTTYVVPGGTYFATASNVGTKVLLDSTFVGVPIAGTWELTVGDHEGGDLGSLGGWTIAFEVGASFVCGDALAGDCLTPRNSPACNDAECCEEVCLLTDLCCEIQWDALCVQLAVEFCDPAPLFVEPLAYSSMANSPWDVSQLGANRILETFEDGILHLPGTTISAGAIKNPGPTTDSVDADDGVVNGIGTTGRSWSVPAGTPVNFTFDPAVLGGYPKQAGLVVTSSAFNTTVTMTVYRPSGTILSQTIYSFAAGGVQGSTADDRFVGVSAGGGISRITLAAATGELELDHVQYSLPVPDGATIYGPTPYVSAASSPLNVAGLGYSFALEDFEDHAFDTPGVSHNFAFIVPPGPVTDSVDGDDTVVDGFGINGRSIYTGAQPVTTLTFDSDALGGPVTSFGIVATDSLTANQRITLSIFSPAGQFVGLREFPPLFDNLNNGTTAEDRFLGCVAPGGIGRVELSPGFIEYDHVQYALPSRIFDPFVGPTPYLSAADSPWSESEDPPAHYFLDTIEDASFDDLPGASATFSQVVLPSIFTDSVDGDDGLIDGNGNGGHTLLQLLPGPMQITFDIVDGVLPGAFGFVWTDGGVGLSNVTLQVFDGADMLVSEKTFLSLGDNSSQGTTAEDRFLGVSAQGGIGSVLIWSNRAFEVDHLQILVPYVPAMEGDLNDDDAVNGADLGLLLGNWGGTGAGDMNADGIVNGADLGLLLALWN